MIFAFLSSHQTCLSISVTVRTKIETQLTMNGLRPKTPKTMNL